jgi:hypothetical protein
MKTLRVPNEPRFVRAFALAVDPGDAFGLLMEIGALAGPDTAIVRRTRGALVLAYDQASDLQDWEQVHTVSVLREALAQPDGAAYLAYHVRHNPQAVPIAAVYAETLAVVGCAADSLGVRHRPWEIEPGDLHLPEWRQRVQRLLRDNALPRPATATGDEGES